MSELPSKPVVLPLVYLRKGAVVRHVGEGYTPLIEGGGSSADVFEVTDSLFSKYHRIYLVDLDGQVGGDPQLDYLQEISRGHEVWVEAAPSSPDQVIDLIVAGGTRVVVSTAGFNDLRTEVRRTLALTEEIALGIEISGGTVRSADARYAGVTLQKMVEDGVEWGVRTFVISSPEMGWESISEAAKHAEIYVKGVRPEEMESFRASGASGAILEVSHGG